MAHFAQLDENNIVIQVIVVNNNILDSLNEEESGINYCKSLFGGNWKQTSYNGNIRKNYAGIGFTYDSVRDAFIPPKPFESWILDEDTCLWNSPSPHPDNGQIYKWVEEDLNWQLVD